MNLPELSPLQEEQSTYITFSKSFLDFDKAFLNKTACYFTKFVAINLPYWKNPDFYIDLSLLGVNSTNPNIVFPKVIQYYMENIIRQSISIDGEIIPEITELAFWKTIRKLGLTEIEAKNIVTFVNSINTSNFITTENNNGWNEIVCQIPNKCKSLIKAFKTLPNIKNTIQCSNEDICLFDNGLQQILFDESKKQVIDFDNLVFSEVDITEFDFNTLLLFYKDSDGVEKLHGINFIYPFENFVTEWQLPKFTHKTNVISTIGYQFKFNLKSCNNDATKIAVYSQDEHTHWNTFSDTLSKLNSFLEIKMKDTPSLIL